MLTIRPSTPNEIPRQKELWKKCFGDPAPYIDFFYDKVCPAGQVMVAEADGTIASMAALLPATLRTPEGEALPVSYLYALATDPDLQGRGHARELLQAADQHLLDQGYKAMALVPASPSLHKFFAATGMDECFAHRKSEFLASSLSGDAGGGTITPIGPEEYNAIREAYLHGSLYLSYPQELIELQAFSSKASGGGLYRVEVADDAEVGCAAIEYTRHGDVLMKELLTYHQYTRRAVELVAKLLPAERYLLRTPAVWEGFSGNYTQPFGMIKWYDPALQRRFGENAIGYLGLAFD